MTQRGRLRWRIQHPRMVSYEASAQVSDELIEFGKFGDMDAVLIRERGSHNSCNGRVRDEHRPRGSTALRPPGESPRLTFDCEKTLPSARRLGVCALRKPP